MPNARPFPFGSDARSDGLRRRSTVSAVILTDEQVAQLVLSVRATIGIEAIVWLVDVAGLSRHDAAELTRWSAQALLHHAVTVPPPTSGGSGRDGVDQ